MAGSTTYWELEYGTAHPQVEMIDADDWQLEERVWIAAHEAGPVESWEPIRLRVIDERGFGDVMQAGASEFHVYSPAFQAAVDACRSEADRYAWLPVTVVDEASGEERAYAVLNVEGPDGCPEWPTVDEELARDRNVVLCGIGDDEALFSDAVQRSLAEHCPEVSLRPGRAD